MPTLVLLDFGRSFDLLELESPQGYVRIELTATTSQNLCYRVHFDGRLVADKSLFGLIIDGNNLGYDMDMGEPEYREINTTYTTRGDHRRAVNHFREMTVPLTHRGAGSIYELQDSYRKYKDRYKDEGFDTWGHDGPNDHYGIYEAMCFESPMDSLYPGSRTGVPVLVKFVNNGGYGIVSEANLVDYSGMVLQLTEDRGFRVSYYNAWDDAGGITTPWRLLMLSADLNGLVNSDLLTNVCPPPPKPLKDLAWIRPGRVTWSWYSSGTGSAE